jgi:hypothetical protein
VRADRFDLPLRIVVDGPIPGLAMALQRGADEIVGRATSSAAPLAFDFDVTVHGMLADGRPRFVGPWVHGPPAERFVYLRVGQHAGQMDTPWGGRVKVPLRDIAWAAIDALAPGHRLEGRVNGRGRKDGPALASVPILPPGWMAVVD